MMRLGRLLSALGIDAVTFDAARNVVLGSAACRDALHITPAALDPQCTALARAIVAQAIFNARQQEPYPADILDAATRDETVRSVSGALGMASLSITGWVAKQLFGLAQQLGAMDHVQRRRGAISDATYPFAGDVLVYLARTAERSATSSAGVSAK